MEKFRHPLMAFVQVEIIDLLYRCAKHGSVPDIYLAAFSNKVGSKITIR